MVVAFNLWNNAKSNRKYPDININDEVTIWGGESHKSRLEYISNKHNLIPYIYLTSLSNRVEKKYV